MRGSLERIRVARNPAHPRGALAPEAIVLLAVIAALVSTPIALFITALCGGGP